jgi:hypothetical protein
MDGSGSGDLQVLDIHNDDDAATAAVTEQQKGLGCSD